MSTNTPVVLGALSPEPLAYRRIRSFDGASRGPPLGLRWGRYPPIVLRRPCR